MIELNVISANEARAYIEDDWREKLNEIYDGVRTAIVKKDNSYCFDVSELGGLSRELVFDQLTKKDGYRLIQTAWCTNHYVIFW